MKNNFECHEESCAAIMEDKKHCVWGYEDNIDVSKAYVCPKIKEILKNSMRGFI